MVSESFLHRSKKRSLDTPCDVETSLDTDQSIGRAPMALPNLLGKGFLFLGQACQRRLRFEQVFPQTLGVDFKKL